MPRSLTFLKTFPSESNEEIEPKKFRKEIKIEDTRRQSIREEAYFLEEIKQN